MATKKHTYKVTDAFGGVHTRKTARTYSHVVLIRQPMDKALTEARDCAASNGIYAAGWVKRVAELEAFAVSNPDGLTPWGDLAWAGRPDLAAKVVAQYQKSGNFAGCVYEIVEVPPVA